MNNFLIFLGCLAVIGTLNYRLRRPCKVCKKDQCDGDVTFTHSVHQCQRDHCFCRGWKAILKQLL